MSFIFKILLLFKNCPANTNRPEKQFNYYFSGKLIIIIDA